MKDLKKKIANKYIDTTTMCSKKKEPPKISVVMKFSQEMIDKLDEACEDEGLPRNHFMYLALDHYWECIK